MTTKKQGISLVAVLAFALMATLARADQITFSFIAASNTDTINATASGVTAGPAMNILVSDSRTGASFSLSGVVTAFTGPATSFVVSTSPNLVVGSFKGAGFQSVLIKDGIGNVIVSGNMQDSASIVAGYPAGAGAFLGKFEVTTIASSVLSLFGLASDFSPDGSIGLTFGQTQLLGSDDLVGVIGGGTVTVQAPTVVPEPASLSLLGCGVLGAAFVVRRRFNV